MCTHQKKNIYVPIDNNKEKKKKRNRVFLNRYFYTKIRTKEITLSMGFWSSSGGRITTFRFNNS